MDTIRLILRFVHFLSWAALIGGLLTQLTASDKRVMAAAHWGARLALLSGVLLVIVRSILAVQDGMPLVYPKIGAKLLLSIIPVALLEVGRRRGLSGNTFWGALGSSALAVAVAVFWV
jgi:hypothetical protein